VAVLLELGPELDEHGGADDDGADDDGVRDHGAVDHRHLGQEEPRLDELDDHGHRLFCGDGKGQTVSAQVAQGWAGNARRYARRRL
jgi:hypothetical protein